MLGYSIAPIVEGVIWQVIFFGYFLYDLGYSRIMHMADIREEMMLYLKVQPTYEP